LVQKLVVIARSPARAEHLVVRLPWDMCPFTGSERRFLDTGVWRRRGPFLARTPIIHAPP
jgi:hypothetical protein